MRGFISFIPLDPNFLERYVRPLWEGQSVDPTEYQKQGWNHYQASVQSQGWQRALRTFMDPPETKTPLPADAKEKIIHQVRGGLKKLFVKEDQEDARLRELIEPELVLRGRPYFIFENAAQSVAAMAREFLNTSSTQAVDDLAREQLVRADPELARRITSPEMVQMKHSMAYRAELLEGLKSIFTLGKAFRSGGTFKGDITEHQSLESIVTLLPWYSALLYSRTSPIWIAENVDGIATVANALDLPLPQGACNLSTQFDPFESRSLWPKTNDLELQPGNSLGVYIPPGEIVTFLDWLNGYGAQMLREAAAYGEGQRMKFLLKKIKECVVYAQKHNYGYLECAGIEPCHWTPLRTL